MRRSTFAALAFALTASTTTAEDLVSVSRYPATLFLRPTDAPTCPPTGTRGIYYDTSSNALYAIDDACAVVALEGGGGGGAPTTATYITQTPDATLSAEQAMSLLGTGLVVNTTGTGVQSIYAGSGTCAASNWMTALSSAGAKTCSQPAFSDISGAVTDAQVPDNITITLAATATALAADPSDCGANTFAQSIAASGALTCAAVNLASSDVSGVLPYNKGGTGQNTLGAAGQYLKVNALETGLDYGTITTDAPTNAEYIVSEANGTLSAEVAPSAANQVPVSSSSTAAAWGTVPDAALTSNYSGVGTCTNQFARVLNDNAAPTCATVSLTADVTGTLPLGNGGTGLTVNTVRLAADSALSTVTFTNLTGMSFTLAANTNYSFQCHMYNTANAATVGVQYQVTFGGTVTNVIGMLQAPSSTTAVSWFSDTTFSLTFQPLNSQGNVAGESILSGTVEVSGTGGTLQFQHASETATLTTTQRGSWCSIVRY